MLFPVNIVSVATMGLPLDPMADWAEISVVMVPTDNDPWFRLIGLLLGRSCVSHFPRNGAQMLDSRKRIFGDDLRSDRTVQVHRVELTADRLRTSHPRLGES